VPALAGALRLTGGLRLARRVHVHVHQHQQQRATRLLL
jgi:hypothetical protein